MAVTPGGVINIDLVSGYNAVTGAAAGQVDPAASVAPAVNVDPTQLANVTYGKIIPLFVGGKARIGGSIIFGPYVQSGLGTFAVSMGVPANVTGSRVLLDIALDSKIAWTADGGFVSEPFTYRFYPGTLTQAADVLEASQFPSGPCAYRPQIVLFFEQLDLSPFGGKIPYVAPLIGDDSNGANPDDGINLGTALERLAASPWGIVGGLDKFATDGITDMVDAVLIGQNVGFVELLQTITRFYRHLDIIQNDKLRVIDRGVLETPDVTFGTPTILTAQKPCPFTRAAASSVPRVLELITLDSAFDYVPVPAIAQRPRNPVAVSGAVNKDSVTLPLVMGASTRQSLVFYAQYAEEVERMKLSFALSPTALDIEPADQIELIGFSAGFPDGIYKVAEISHDGDFSAKLTVQPILRAIAAADIGPVTPPDDGAFDNVVLLVGADDPDIPDESPRHHGNAGINGSAQISSTQSKFGGFSLAVDGTSDWAEWGASTDWALAPTNSFPYTVEAWFWTTTVAAGFAQIVGVSGGAVGSRGFQLGRAGTAVEWWWAHTAGSAWQHITSSGVTLATNRWYAIAVDHDATGKIRLYLDGVMVASSTPADSTITGGSVAVSLGSNIGGGEGFSGFIDEVRITKGTARYASDAGYTVTTSKFPRTAGSGGGGPGGGGDPGGGGSGPGGGGGGPSGGGTGALLETLSGDSETFAQGSSSPYWANNLVLSPSDTHTQTIAIYDTFPPGTVLTWSWPAVDGSYAFPDVAWAGGDAAPSTILNITPTQVSGIAQLSSTFDIAISGETNHFSAVYDFFLRNSTSGSVNNSNSLEITLILHAPAASSASLQFSYTASNSGIAWQVRSQTVSSWKQIIVQPSPFADVLAGTFNFRELFDQLISHSITALGGAAVADLHVSGVALGANPAQGAGSLTVNAFSVGYIPVSSGGGGGGTVVRTLTTSSSNPIDGLFAYPSSGPFFAHLDPWGASSFDDPWSYQIVVKDTNPHGAEMSWVLGSQGGRNVAAAPQIVWRGADWWAATNAGITNNFADQRAVRMDKITELTCYVDLVLSGDTSGFGAGMDFYIWDTDSYFTESRNGSYEILVAFDYGSQAGGRASPTFTLPPDSWGTRWDVIVQESGSSLARGFLVLQPNAGPIHVGYIDFLFIFTQIANNPTWANICADWNGRPFALANLYFSHLRLDCEIAGQTGGMIINKWYVAYSDNTGIAGNQYNNYGT